MDPRSFKLPQLRRLLAQGEWKDVLWGDLSGMPLPDLLNILGQGRRTGLLAVRTRDGGERALVLRDGLVTWAAAAGTEDVREVAFQLVQLKDGAFVFLRGADEVLPASDRASPVHEILLDSLRRMDEEKRAANG